MRKNRVRRRFKTMKGGGSASHPLTTGTGNQVLVTIHNGYVEVRASHSTQPLDVTCRCGILTHLVYFFSSQNNVATVDRAG